MPIYCKAFHVRDVRHFLTEKKLAEAPLQTLADDDLCFLWEDLLLTTDCFEKEELLLREVTPAWERYCRDVLAFRVPEDLQRDEA